MKFKIDNLGYCCINQTLRQQKIYTGRSLIRRTFSIEKASELALKNCQDLLKIILWNIENEINVFRIGSDIFPRITDKINGYNHKDLSNYEKCEKLLATVGEIAYDNNIILSCHPGPYTVLGSENKEVALSSVKEIMCHYYLGKMLKANAPMLQFNINFHIGNKYSVDSAERFCLNFESLPDKAKDMIIIENDDKVNCWSVLKLYNYIYKRTGIPITFDYHHSNFSREKEMSVIEEFNLAKETWKNKLSFQEIHYSSSETNILKHSDYILEEIPNWLINLPNTYVLLEAKQKELALLEYRKKYLGEKL